MAPFLVHLAIGPLMLVTTLIFKKFPPKKINHTYGYRSKRSMQNLDTWNVANEYSLDWMLKVSALVCLCQIFLYFLLSQENAILVACIILVVGLVAIFPLTEGHLKTIFDENGNRKDDLVP